MADFSKQYCDKYDPGFPHDFDYEEIAKDLKPGFYQPAMCEGFGSVGVARDDDGTVVLVFFNYHETGTDPKWVPLDQVTDKTHREIWQKKVEVFVWNCHGFLGYKTKAPKPPKERRYRRAPSSGDCEDCIGMYGQTGECYCDQVTKES